MWPSSPEHCSSIDTAIFKLRQASVYIPLATKYPSCSPTTTMSFQQFKGTKAARQAWEAGPAPPNSAAAALRRSTNGAVVQMQNEYVISFSHPSSFSFMPACKAPNSRTDSQPHHRHQTPTRRSKSAGHPSSPPRVCSCINFCTNACRPFCHFNFCTRCFV